MFGFRTALLISALLPTTALAAQGTVSIAPDTYPEPKAYATTAALMADSIGLAWDGEAPVLVRLRIVEVIEGVGDRFLAGDTLTLAPGSQMVRLQDLLAPMMIGGDLPVVRWAQASSVIEPRQLTVDRWKDALMETLGGEEFSINWDTEAVLVIGMSLEATDQPEETFSMSFLVVRPAPLP